MNAKELLLEIGYEVLDDNNESYYKPYGYENRDDLAASVILTNKMNVKVIGFYDDVKNVNIHMYEVDAWLDENNTIHLNGGKLLGNINRIGIGYEEIVAIKQRLEELGWN